MVSTHKMTPWLMAIFCLVTAGCSNVTDQQTSETSHDQQVAILKQIRKVNEDGSYTFGYEAGDGSFKEHVSVVQSIPRTNRTASTTRKPTIVYSSEASTRSSVVQSIPRTRKTTTTSTTTTPSTTTTSTENSRTIYGHYIKATPKSRPRFVINGQQRPLVIEEDIEDEDSQINRPSTDEKDSVYRRIVYARRPIDHSLRPITEDFEEKEDDPKITTGNTLRRQLSDDTTKSSSIHDHEDHSDVYGGSLHTTRPLFTTTTTTPSRLLQRVSGLRAERPKTIYVNRDGLSASKYDGPRVYESEAKAAQDEREPPQQFLIRAPQRLQQNANGREYVRQGAEPVYVRQQSEQQYLRELPPTGILVQAQPGNLDDEAGYRAIPVGRILLRPLASQRPIYSTTTDANVHYLTENPIHESIDDARVPINHNYVRPRPYSRQLSYPEQDPPQHRLFRPVPQPLPHPMDDRDQHQATVAPEYPYRSSTIALPPEAPNPITPPLSRRDFQLLLRRLLVSQYGAQALSYPKNYLDDALYDQQPYPSYQPAYQTPAPGPRHEIAYDQSQITPQYGDRVQLRRPGFSRALNPLYQPNQYDDYPDSRYSKRVYRQKFYAQEVSDDGDEVLPPPIREALLLRMLQLAINPDRSSLPGMMMTTASSTSKYRKTGPVRSVQIITDDSDEEKDVMGKKM